MKVKQKRSKLNGGFILSDSEKEFYK